MEKIWKFLYDFLPSFQNTKEKIIDDFDKWLDDYKKEYGNEFKKITPRLLVENKILQAYDLLEYATANEMQLTNPNLIDFLSFTKAKDTTKATQIKKICKKSIYIRLLQMAL